MPPLPATSSLVSGKETSSRKAKTQPEVCHGPGPLRCRTRVGAMTSAASGGAPKRFRKGDAVARGAREGSWGGEREGAGPAVSHNASRPPRPFCLPQSLAALAASSPGGGRVELHPEGRGVGGPARYLCWVTWGHQRGVRGGQWPAWSELVKLRGGRQGSSLIIQRRFPVAN